MRVRSLAWGVVVGLCTVAIQAQETPYAGLEGRKIKALSEQEITAYEEGHGMGLAMVAELNSYPGPKHVLELADELGLDDAQLGKTHEIYRRMHKSAVRLGNQIVSREEALDGRFTSGGLEEDVLRASLFQVAELQAELRFVHLRAHLRMKRVLSAEQVATYDRLRGYGSGASPAHHGHGQHR